MARLIYSAISSLDGYLADQEGRFDWAEPDEEVHTFWSCLTNAVSAAAWFTSITGSTRKDGSAAWAEL